jgi:hypothetical protein
LSIRNNAWTDVRFAYLTCEATVASLVCGSRPLEAAWNEFIN